MLGKALIKKNYQTKRMELNWMKNSKKLDSEMFSIPKPKTKRWKWTEEITDSLFACLIESEMEHECNGNNFRSDLVTLHGNTCEKMAKQFGLEHFG